LQNCSVIFFPATLTEKKIGHENAAQQTAARSEKDFKDLEL